MASRGAAETELKTPQVGFSPAIDRSLLARLSVLILLNNTQHSQTASYDAAVS